MEYLRLKNIFIIDDDKMLTEALKDYLTRYVQHQIRIFHTGEECLSNLKENPDVIILDYYLDTVNKAAANGIQILEIIKKKHPNIHVIMLSSQERYGIAMQTVQKGAEQYVVKGKDAFEKIAQMINELT